LLSSGYAIAEPLKVGPWNIVVRVNSIEVPVMVAGSVDCTTARGDLNANGELTASIDAARLRDDAISILKALLPFSFQVSGRELTVEKVSSLEILEHDYEVDLTAKVIASIGSSWFERSQEIGLKISAIPRVLAGKKLGWKLVRQAHVDLPRLWWVAMEITSGDPNKIAGEAIQKWLDEHASFDVPSISGIRISFQGANFDGDAKTVAFRIKADAHTDSVGFTNLVGTLIKPADLDFTVKLPPKLNETDLNERTHAQQSSGMVASREDER
jgi:hypothetical protein